MVGSGIRRTTTGRTALIGLCLTLGVGVGATVANGSIVASPAGAAGNTFFATANGTTASSAGNGDCTTQEAIPANDCSLAAALGVANPGDTIDLITPGIFTNDTTFYSAAANGGPFVVGTTASTSPITIQAATGNGPAPIIDGGQTSQIFTVGAGVTVDLSGLILQNGVVSNNAAGGAIMNAGILTVSRSTFAGNSAGTGGAIANTGTLTVSDSTFRGIAPGRRAVVPC